MKSLLALGLVVAALVAGAAVPAASAKSQSASAVKIANVPLPASKIGPAAKSLPLQRADSGRIQRIGGAATSPNRDFLSEPNLSGFGLETGYALDYGLGASGGSGITEVRTSVDRYDTPVGARKALGVWKRSDPVVTAYDLGGFDVTATAKRVPRVGSRHFAYLVTYSASDITPLYGLDEHFTEGRYEGDVTVWAGTAAAAQQLAPKLAEKLDARIKRAMAGKLHEKPVKLPPAKKAGPAPGGPDLSVLALHKSDLSGSCTVTQVAHKYRVGRPLSDFALSEFWVNFKPAGKYTFVSQMIGWFATANQASLEADFLSAPFVSSPINLSSVGDGARGSLQSPSGGPGYAEVVFQSGQLEELLAFSSTSKIKPADVRGIAEKVAGYINGAGLGS